jgi:hypothetical protein
VEGKREIYGYVCILSYINLCSLMDPTKGASLVWGDRQGKEGDAERGPHGGSRAPRRRVKSLCAGMDPRRL